MIFERIVFYHFKRDYSYLDVRYYSSNQELTDIIVNSDDERWLIFIDNTNVGMMKANLGGKLTLSVELSEGTAAAVRVKKQ